MGFRKTSPTTAPAAARIEAAGLRWLAEAGDVGGAAVAEVLDVHGGVLTLEEITFGAPSREAAEAFGVALAHTHRSLPAGMEFGSLPPDHPPGTPPLFGPADQLVEMGSGTHRTWGLFQAAERLDPMWEHLQASSVGGVDPAEQALFQRARDRIGAGDFDGEETPSRIHGDLWAGNLLWWASTGRHGTRAGAGQGVASDCVLIDPSAHAGHRESDLAMMRLFGMPHLEVMLQAYDATAPLEHRWRDRVPVHQLFYLLAHWALFGRAYAGPTLRACEDIVML